MKKKTVKRIFSCMLCSSLLFGLLACGNTPSSETKESAKDNKERSSLAKETEKKQDSSATEESKASEEPVKEKTNPITLEWYYGGNGVQKDTEVVNDKLNELLQKTEGFEHITVKLNPSKASEYATDVLLAQTSGKQMDILGTYGLDYNKEVGNGTFAPLTDMLAQEKYESLKNEFPEWLWEMISINRDYYIVPNYQRAANKLVMLLPKDYSVGLEKEIDQLRGKCDTNGFLTDLDYWEFAKKVVDNARKITGKETKYIGNLLSGKIYYGNGIHREFIFSSSSINGFEMIAGTGKVGNLFLTDEYKEYVKTTAQLYQDGYFDPESMLRDQSTLRDKNMLNDVSYAIEIYQTYGDLDTMTNLCSKQLGFETVVIDMRKNYFMLGRWGAGGNGITSSCKNKEDAFSFLQLINTKPGEEIYNTIVYGLEGMHYTKIDDTHIKTLEYDGSQGSDNSYSAAKWKMGNTFYAWLNQGCSDADNAIALEINSNPNNIISQCLGFYTNTEPINSELDQIAAIVSEYMDTLNSGSLGTGWEQYYNEFVGKLEVAGVQKVISEIQTQYDNWKQ